MSTLPYYFSDTKTGQPDLWGYDTTKNPFCPVKQHFAAKITTLLQQAPFVGHLSRQKFVGQFILGLIKSRNVQFGEVAQHLILISTLLFSEERGCFVFFQQALSTQTS